MGHSFVDLLELIKSRRSIRAYQDKPVPKDVLTRLLEAACWAPSAHNRQPWRFAVIQNDNSRTTLANAMAARLAADLRKDGVAEEVIAKDTSRSRARITQAPVAIVVGMTMRDMDAYPDEVRQHNEWVMATQSVAMAAQNLLLMAHAEGLGAVWMCAPLFCPEVVRQTVDLPDDVEPQGLIVLGYPAQEREKTRAPLETRVVFQ